MHLCLIIRLSSVSYHLNFEKNTKVILPTWEAPYASTLGIDLRRTKIHQTMPLSIILQFCYGCPLSMEEMGSTPGKKKNPQNAMCNRQTGSHQVVSQNLQTLAHNYKVTPFAMKKWPDNRDDLSNQVSVPLKLPLYQPGFSPTRATPLPTRFQFH
jgi:hypothetical protein